MIVAMQASLLVLAGGHGRRMGRSKAWLEVGDTTLVRWVAGRLAPSFMEVLVSFAEPEQLEDLIPYRVVFDRAGTAGPLAGIEAGLAAARYGTVFAIACDMPFVTPAVAVMAVSAARGSDAAVPRIGARPEPLAAAYSKSALPAISAALDAGDFKAAGVLATMEVTWLESLDGRLFRSLNTPEDYRDFHSALRHSDN